VPVVCGTAKGWFSLARFAMKLSCFWCADEGFVSGSRLEKKGDVRRKKYMDTVLVVAAEGQVKLGDYEAGSGR
jgi:hypothetical protein